MRLNELDQFFMRCYIVSGMLFVIGAVGALISLFIEHIPPIARNIRPSPGIGIGQIVLFFIFFGVWIMSIYFGTTTKFYQDHYGE